MKTKTKKRRYTLAERQAMAHESLARATGRETATNYPAIFAGFEAKGIDPDDIKPRVNVFTYRAWLALGRQVRKGEHGVKVITIVPCKSKTVDGKPEVDKNGNPKTFGRKSRATVFHVSQTDAIDGADPVAVPGVQSVDTLMAPAVVSSVVADCRQLSSGTMGTLTGKSDFASLDTIQAAFVSFVESKPGAFDTWQDAWEAWDFKPAEVEPSTIPQPYAERAADQYAGWSGHQESEAKPAGMLF